jgi:heat shock protein HslJ
MKKLLILLTAISIMGCASTGRGTSGPDFSDIVGKDWKLIEVYVDGKNTQFSRASFQNNNFMRDMFTLKFSEKTVNGTGAPNMFGSQYTQGNNQTLSIMPMVTTLMAPMPFQPENLTEQNFYSYLQSAQKWGLVRNNLEIYSRTEDKHDIRLVFGL